MAISACGTPPPAPPAAAPAPAAPSLQASQAAHRIVAGESLIAITVRRGGPLARMGHDHLVATRQIEGFVDLEQGRTELRFRLDQLTVDEAALRKEAGLATQPSADAIDGTRRNMFSKVLQAQAYPWVLVRAAFEAGMKDRLRVEVTLHGVTRSYQVQMQLREDGSTVLANGAFTVKQSDFGITPFAVFGGALAVKDELELKFAISARR
ncbi:YceI family protein [Duganella sp. CF458]|uniref:YceI family protein n=1 Tax=Duganella sp. CF458 TaxID=1884368 RepID=UPI001E512358|nr:YceI family protein [Duganella sp. CF458]